MLVLTRGSKKGTNQVIQKWLLQIFSYLMIVNFSGLVKLYLKLWVHKRILTTGENCLQIERQSLFAFLSFKTVLHSFEKPTLWQPSDVQNHVIPGETKIVEDLCQKSKISISGLKYLNCLSVQEIGWHLGQNPKTSAIGLETTLEVKPFKNKPQVLILQQTKMSSDKEHQLPVCSEQPFTSLYQAPADLLTFLTALLFIPLTGSKVSEW